MKINDKLLDCCNKDELISVCKTWGIPYYGTKAVIVKRMKNHMLKCKKREEEDETTPE